jgi:hypothetical protein
VFSWPKRISQHSSAIAKWFFNILLERDRVLT